MRKNYRDYPRPFHRSRLACRFAFQLRHVARYGISAFFREHLGTIHSQSRRQKMLTLALPLSSGLVVNHASVARAGAYGLRVNAPLMDGGKGFGGGEATRDPEPTAWRPERPER